MNNQITIREAVTENDVALFWEQLHTYHKRDIFCAPNDEDLEYFLGSEYHDHMMMVHRRKQNPAYFLFFQRNGTDIGFAMPVIFTSEDGKCFIMEFCVFPEFRGNGTGKECVKALLRWAKEHGALYAELNYGSNKRRLRFWKSIGFIENGVDEWGEPLMLLPPEEEIPFTVEVLQGPTDWQLLKLQNGFKKRDLRRSTIRGTTKAASGSRTRRQNYILSCQTGLPCRRNVQCYKSLFHLYLPGYGHL